MKITILTAGTGSYYCGACMRDNALARELIARGHETHLVPMYLPLRLDEERVDDKTPVFFGGINVFLQEKYGIFRRFPSWVDRLLNRPSLLRAVAKRSHLTSAREQGEMTCKMLRLEESNLGRETDKLVEWLQGEEGGPDVVLLSNALLAGLAGVLKERLGVPVVCTFQGEDSFLDGLPDPWREKAWTEMAAQVRECHALVAPSRFFAGVMESRLGLAEGAISVVPNGIDLQGYGMAEPRKRIGFLSRMCAGKGLGRLVEAVICLDDPSIVLAVAGTMGGGDKEYVASLKARLEKAGMSNRVEWYPDLDRAEKIAFLRSLTVFSVPTAIPEAFGLYLIEAMACGVPVVMPRVSAFPEIVGEAGCGVLVEPGSAEDLARGLREVIDSPDRVTMGKKVGGRWRFAIMSAQWRRLLKISWGRWWHRERDLRVEPSGRVLRDRFGGDCSFFQLLPLDGIGRARLPAKPGHSPAPRRAGMAAGRSHR